MENPYRETLPTEWDDCVWRYHRRELMEMKAEAWDEGDKAGYERRLQEEAEMMKEKEEQDAGVD